jgi:hypothetical protein
MPSFVHLTHFRGHRLSFLLSTNITSRKIIGSRSFHCANSRHIVPSIHHRAVNNKFSVFTLSCTHAVMGIRLDLGIGIAVAMVAGFFSKTVREERREEDMF